MPNDSHHVSVEPLPKQGCEMSKAGQHQVEPLPKQGCEAGPRRVSVEPLPKQGCEAGI